MTETHARQMLPTKLTPQKRSLSIRADGATVDADSRTVKLSFSSEEPVDMWYGTEILSHERGAVRAKGVRQESMPLLFNHDPNDLLGVVESIEISTKDRKGYATVRFGKDERGDWAMRQVDDGVLTNVSFMYRVHEWTENAKKDAVTATDWEPYEISLVTVPADATVGVGRADAAAENPVLIHFSTPAARAAISEESNDMDPSKAATAADPAGVAPGNVVDIASVRAAASTEAAAGERARITEIHAMCRTHNLPHDFSDKLIASQADIATARGAVLAALAARGGDPRPASAAGAPDMTSAEKRQWSLTRAVNAALTGDWSKAGFEREVSAEISKQLGKAPREERAFFMPQNIPFEMPAPMGKRATYQVGTAAQGGNLVQTMLMYDNFIEVLRNVSVTGQLGAMILPGLVGNVNIPRQNAATATYWVTESGAVTEAEATFDQVQLRPHTLGALSKMSRLMLLQGTPAIEQIARVDLLNQIILGVDAAALYGTGASGQPTGIASTSGIGSVVGGTNGANWTFDQFIQLYAAPRVGNAPQNALGFAINAKTYGYLSTLKSTTGQYLWMPNGGITVDPGDTLRGYRYAVSNQLRSTLTKGTSSGICSEAIFGNWNELILGEWGSLEIAVNPYDSTGFTTGDVYIRAFQTVDVGVRHAASFAYMGDGLTPNF